MPPLKTYWVKAIIGLRFVPVALGYYKAYTKQGAINKALEENPLVKDGVLISKIIAMEPLVNE